MELLKRIVNIPTTKEGALSFVQALEKQIEDGLVGEHELIEILAKLGVINFIVDEVKQSPVITEKVKVAKGNNTNSYNGIKIGIRTTPKYDYSGNNQWQNLTAKIDVFEKKLALLKEQRKEVEDKMRLLTNKSMMVTYTDDSEEFLAAKLLNVKSSTSITIPKS